MYHMKRKTIQMTRDVKKRHHTVKSYCNYTKNTITNMKFYLGDLKHELSYSILMDQQKY